MLALHMGWQTEYRTKRGHVNRTAHWRDENGKHRSATLGAVSREHVDAFIAAREDEVRARQTSDAVDVDATLDAFAAWLGDERSPYTVRMYTRYMRRVLDAWAGTPTASWTPDAFRALVRSLDLGPSSRACLIRSARAFIRWPGLEVPDFATGWTTPRVKSRVPDTLSREGRRRLIEAARRGPLAVPVALAAGMALRPKEWRRAKHADVRWLDAALRVRRKGGHDQVLPVPPTVLAVLKESAEKPDLIGSLADLSPRVVLQRLYRLCAAEGLPRVSWYGLRHTALTLMAEREPIHVVQRYAGHASIQTTQIYLHAQEHHLRRAADRDL